MIADVLDDLKLTGVEFDFCWRRFAKCITDDKQTLEEVMSKFLSTIFSMNIEHADDIRRDINSHFHQLQLSLSHLLDTTKKREEE